MLASDFIVDRLIQLGVRHVFGVGGANIEDMFSAVQRRRPDIQAVLGKHEHAAGTAADAYARLRGLGVVMTTSGGGAMNLVHALAEARASEVPLLAIVGEPPTNLQGHGAFQDTSGRGGAVDAHAVFQAVTTRCTRVEDATELPRSLDDAVDSVLGSRPGPAVLLVAKDLQRAEVSVDARSSTYRTAEGVFAPKADELRSAAAWLDVRPIVIVAGPEVTRTGTQEELAVLADRLDARVATTPDARDAFDNRHSRFIGVSGAMGHAAVRRAIGDARLVVLAGTSLPQLARQGLEVLLSAKRLLSLGRLPPFAPATETLHVQGDLATTLRSLVARLAEDAAAPARTPASALAVPLASSPTSVVATLRAIDRLAPEKSVVLVDAGNTGASAIHHVRAPFGGHWLVAMGMAGMGYTFGAATGAAFATSKRCIVLAGDGAFFMHGMEVHTAIEHLLPITYVIFNNRAHGMCLVRERLFLGENAGYNAFRASHVGAGLAAMFPDLPAADCSTPDDFARLFESSLARTGPSVIGVELSDVEIPPFTAFQERTPSIATVAREVGDG